MLAVLPPISAQAAETPSLDEQIAATDTVGVIDTAPNESRAPLDLKKLLASNAPEATFDALSAEDQSLFKAYATVDRTTVTTEYTPADAVAKRSVTEGRTPNGMYSPTAAGCWVGTAYTYGKNVFGNNLWRVQLNGYWCSSGARVTTASLDGSWGQTYWIGWSHKGRIGSGSGVVSNQGRTWVQHKFTYGTGGWDVQERTPCLRTKGTSAGRVSADLGCGLY